MYSKTQRKIQQQLAAGVYPGVCYAFIKGEAVEKQVYGFRQLIPDRRVMTVDTLFDVASLTKVICTTTVVLKLLEQGHLQLDTPLQRYLPTFQNDQITLRHLLTHTSDIQTWIPNRDQLNEQQLEAAYYTLQPGKRLGLEVCYTDAGTILLGFMLEQIYSRPVIDIFKTEVLQPLGMHHSCFLPTNTSNIAATENVGDHVLVGITHDPKARVLGKHAANAGLFSNLEDLLRFSQLYLNLGAGEHEQLLQPTTILQLLQDATPSGQGKRSIGWDLRQELGDGHFLLFHTGYTGTFLLLDVLQKEAFVFLSNRVHPVDDREGYILERDALLKIYLLEKAKTDI